MSSVQRVLGTSLPDGTEGKRMTLEALAARAGVQLPVPIRSRNRAKELHEIQVLETLANALDLSVEQLVALAHGPTGTTAPPLVKTTAPTLDTAYLRPAVPLPEGLTVNNLTRR